MKTSLLLLCQQAEAFIFRFKYHFYKAETVHLFFKKNPIFVFIKNQRPNIFQCQSFSLFLSSQPHFHSFYFLHFSCQTLRVVSQFFFCFVLIPLTLKVKISRHSLPSAKGLKKSICLFGRFFHAFTALQNAHPKQ